MSRPGRLGDGSPSGMVEALRDPNVTQLLHACGEHIDLVVNTMIEGLYFDFPSLLKFVQLRHNEQEWNNVAMWFKPVYVSLQQCLAGCQCSPFGGLSIGNASVSGSSAEGLRKLHMKSHNESSDVDMMIEFGPVHWTFPVTEGTSPVEGTAAAPAAATTADPRGPDSDPTPRLMIADTENPGFVLVLQKRRDDCQHQELLPFKAEDVTQLFKVYQYVTAGKSQTQKNIQGPSCPYSMTVNSDIIADIYKYKLVKDYDEVPCLHVPVWWFSVEFFTRHRQHNWPPEGTRDNIRRYGLHLVPVGAPGSRTEKVQWRLSFSRAEVVIASALTNIQKCAVVLFKACKTFLGEAGKVIKSYYVKTALLWLCERTPVEDWTSVTQGVLKLLDFLDEAVRTGNLPCFFWSRINLLRFASRTDRNAMKKALGSIRTHLTRLLAYAVSDVVPELVVMLTHQSRRLSERQVRVCLARWLVRQGVLDSQMRRITNDQTNRYLKELLPVLLRSYASEDVNVLVHGRGKYWRHVQTMLYQALTVAPADVATQVGFSCSDDGGFTWDAVPLLGLLTEDDLKFFLGDPDHVRAWLRHHHHLSETQRPAGTLPADLRSPRDLCDLLLNIPLLSWVMKESVPLMWSERVALWKISTEAEDYLSSFLPTETEAKMDNLKFVRNWTQFVDDFVSLGMDRQKALENANTLGFLLYKHSNDPKTLTEHRRMLRFLPDHWQLSHFVLQSYK